MRPYKRTLTFLILVTILCFKPTYPKDTGTEVCLKGKCFAVELATTHNQRAQGLMFRKYLKPGQGMFFVFADEQIYTFWMKNTYIPLDIIWINSAKEVVFIKENAKPCKKNNCSYIIPDKKSRYVLELNAGVVQSLDLKVKDKVDFNLLN